MGPQLYRYGNSRLCRAPSGIRYASMGPQLYRCGNKNVFCGSYLRIWRASMGPQLYRCGNGSARYWHARAWASFNGTATLSLRKRQPRLVADVANYVASMEPQLYRCGNYEVGEGHPAYPFVLQWGRNFIVAEILRAFQALFDMEELQWGRNFIVAEILRGQDLHLYQPSCFNGAATLSLQKLPDHRYACILFRSLQWGRNFIVAEMVQDTIDTNSITLLQWGRNFIVAEMYQLQRCLMSARSSFNGAATLSLRKCLYSEKVDVILKSLQWGRNFIVAEISVIEHKFRCNWLASMGPQLYRYGNHLSPWTAGKATL